MDSGSTERQGQPLCGLLIRKCYEITTPGPTQLAEPNPMQGEAHVIFMNHEHEDLLVDITRSRLT